jgi:16S rRNA (uracil1498-N3)-methyltransferase
LITLLVDPAEFAGEEAGIAGEAYRHLFRARRTEIGERLRVVDGQGRARWGEVARVGRQDARVALAEPAPSQEPAVWVELLVTTLRPERAAWLVEKATEVGVSAVRFLNSVRAPRTFGGGTAERLRRVAAAAVEQCHRSRLPEVTGPHAWEEVGRLAAACGDRWLLDVASGESAQETWRRPVGPAAPAGAVLVGPEGGWAPEERGELLATGWTPVGLGPRVLRAETAAVLGVALMVLGAEGG